MRTEAFYRYTYSAGAVVERHALITPRHGVFALLSAVRLGLLSWRDSKTLIRGRPDLAGEEGLSMGGAFTQPAAMARHGRAIHFMSDHPESSLVRECRPDGPAALSARR